MRLQRRQRVRDKQTPQFNTTTQQQAQLNLIQISNSQFPSDLIPNFKEPSSNDGSELKIDKPHMKIRIKQKNMPLLKLLHRSTDLKQSVADKFTESYRANIRASCSQLNTDQVCVITRKLPLSLSSYMVLDTQKKPINHLQYQSSSYKPKPCINIKTYFKKRPQFKNQEKSNWAYQTPRYQARKLYPYEQTYWKIYRGAR